MSSVNASTVLAVVLTGRMTPVPTDQLGDYFRPTWTPEGDVYAVVAAMRSAVWKFTPEGK